MSTPTPGHNRGRPTHTWVDGDACATLPIGTVLAIEPYGRHTARLRARINAATDTRLELTTTTGEATMKVTSIRRARIVANLYEPGDPVLLRHIPATRWRAGVVRHEGTRVLVETMAGFEWVAEADIEPAEVRDRLPALKRGPVPADA